MEKPTKSRKEGGPERKEGSLATPLNLSGEAARAFRNGNTQAVQLSRAQAIPTDDQGLWTAIRTSTDRTNFNAYEAFIDRVLCADTSRDPDETSVIQGLPRRPPYVTSYMGLDAYELLKTATQAFLLVHCGVADLTKVITGNTVVYVADIRKPKNEDGSDAATDADPVTDSSGADESGRVGEPWTYQEASQRLSAYLSSSTGTLPYLDRVVRALFPNAADRVEASPFCGHLLKNRWTCPSLLELIWSFWHEDGMLVQAVNTIALRFQNRRAAGSRDSLAHLKLDPLRPLSNILWGYIQDEPHRLTLARRVYEYDHEYGLTLVGRAVPQLRAADSRSKFVEALHNLLTMCARFFREDDDTTVIADAFPVLNALKEVHMNLALGAHNQFGDLPWTARVEMLIQKWLLSRTEIREYLGSAPMVAYSESWMAQVDTMKSLHGWSDGSVTHFRDLGVFGEQLLLSIRYGDWSNINNSEQARNWARYWRPEIQSYMHSYRAVTGVDLTTDISDVRAGADRYKQPSVLHWGRVGIQRFQRNGSPTSVSGRRLAAV